METWRLLPRLLLPTTDSPPSKMYRDRWLRSLSHSADTTKQVSRQEIAVDTGNAHMCFVNSHKSVSKLKHVVPQADDDELCVFRALLDVVSYD